MATHAWVAKMRKPLKFAGRYRNRCRLCGRPRAFFRDFGLCRICFQKFGFARGNSRRDEVQLVRPGETKSI
jgi:small subunit ribosomal protein S14